MKELVSELIKFPLDRHDDLPDCLSMQLQLWRTTKSKAEQKLDLDEDPMSFSYALESIKDSRRSSDHSLVFDPVHTQKTWMYY